jgi:hypothetical protein
MEKFDLYKDIQTRTGGEIYIGVVGPVRTGKSTFIRKVAEQIILPEIAEEQRKAATDELPASASGKMITTVEPKFIPRNAASVELGDGTVMKMRFVDCVGFIVPGAEGFQENGVVMLEFVEFAVQSDTLEQLSTGNMAALQTEEFYEEAATFLNATEKTTEIKKFLIESTVTEMVGGDTETVAKIMESYDDSAVSTPEAQKQEIEALLSVATSTSEEELMAAIDKIPTIDSELLKDALKNLQQN